RIRQCGAGGGERGGARHAQRGPLRHPRPVRRARRPQRTACGPRADRRRARGDGSQAPRGVGRAVERGARFPRASYVSCPGRARERGDEENKESPPVGRVGSLVGQPWVPPLPGSFGSFGFGFSPPFGGAGGGVAGVVGGCGGGGVLPGGRGAGAGCGGCPAGGAGVVGTAPFGGVAGGTGLGGIGAASFGGTGTAGGTGLTGGAFGGSALGG